MRDRVSVAFLSALELQRLGPVAKKDKAALRSGEADGVFQHGREHIGPRPVLIEALRRLEKERQGIEFGRGSRGDPGG